MTIHGPLAARGQIGRALATAAGGAAFVGAYDAFAASLAHVYEPARRTLTSYIGDLCRLRRASDDAELDWGYLANGDLNVAAIAAWAGGNSYVVTVYDQTANADHVTQADKTKQPLYVANARNGHAGMSFQTHRLDGVYTNGGALSQPYDVFSVAQLDASVVTDVVYRTLANDNGTNNMLMRKTSGVNVKWQVYTVSGILTTAGNANANWNVWALRVNGALSQLRHNAALIGSANLGANVPSGLKLGEQSLGTNFWYGYINNFIVCDPGLSDADRAAMETAVNNYWAVY